MQDKKTTSTFAKVTKFVIWLMLILTIGTTILSAYSAIR
ncbi:DUF4044 domain-containing protein [Enterococcus lemanii]|jgi:hypothetical protein|uniref:DUF4044 domain-containing protein n=1 Tax=Enterococcus lemanii TaxID=1159752 RepID=A0ABV9MZV0_9ENTE|nr:DUF4044 domain-containing protein [Enterococcus lemanii]MBM7708162.1 hypothetical protein [Enterococcus lemanii]NLM67337.1 DUF4044 domain-containing protein [Enterococcus sp.]